MGAKRQFYTMSGEIIGEQATGGARVRYMPDALGSITLANDGATNNSTTYTPCGFGSLPLNTSLGWVGIWAYMPTSLSQMSHYVRARHYDNLRGRWSTVDPIWPTTPPYTYVLGNPTTLMDPTGLAEVVISFRRVKVFQAAWHAYIKVRDCCLGPSGERLCCIDKSAGSKCLPEADDNSWWAISGGPEHISPIPKGWGIIISRHGPWVGGLDYDGPWPHLSYALIYDHKPAKEYQHCLIRAGDRIQASKTNYSPVTGPNSNSFAHFLLIFCNLPIPPPHALPWLPGWDNIPKYWHP